MTLKFSDALLLPADPTANLQAATKQYVDKRTLGTIARGRRTTSGTATSATASTSGQGVLRVTGVALTSGRAYWVAVPNVGVTGSVSGSIGGLQLTYTTDGSTPSVSSSILTLGAVNCTTASQTYGAQVGCYYFPASNLTFGVLFSVWRQSGTGTITTFGDPAWPCDLIIEDHGVDPGNTGTSI